MLVMKQLRGVRKTYGKVGMEMADMVEVDWDHEGLRWYHEERKFGEKLDFVTVGCIVRSSTRRQAANSV
jgi:hypothetical protein